MKKVLIAIFAHPDDEAFGPSGTLLQETKNGTELHLISLTAGEHGMNRDRHENLADIRLKEWRTAGKLLGAFSMYHLGFIDGKLNNVTMLRAVKEIKKIVRDIARGHLFPIEIEFMSMDANGITGHIDHIVASRAAHHAFYDLKQEGLPITKLRLVCIPRSFTGDEPRTDFVFMEPGRRDDEINEVIDAREYLPEIYAIMRAHHSQRDDGETHIASQGEKVAINHFIVKK